MKKIFIFACLFLILFGKNVQAQHFIGLDKEQTRVLARKSGFYEDNMTVSKKFNYLKFVNSADTKTLIVFFSDDDIAKHTRTVCDYSEYDFILKEYDEKYTKIDEDIWEYEEDDQVFQVNLEEKEWYFVVRSKKKL